MYIDYLKEDIFGKFFLSILPHGFGVLFLVVSFLQSGGVTIYMAGLNIFIALYLVVISFFTARTQRVFYRRLSDSFSVFLGLFQAWFSMAVIYSKSDAFWLLSSAPAFFGFMAVCALTQVALRAKLSKKAIYFAYRNCVHNNEMPQKLIWNGPSLLPWNVEKKAWPKGLVSVGVALGVSVGASVRDPSGSFIVLAVCFFWGWACIYCAVELAFSACIARMIERKKLMPVNEIVL